MIAVIRDKVSIMAGAAGIHGRHRFTRLEHIKAVLIQEREAGMEGRGLEIFSAAFPRRGISLIDQNCPGDENKRKPG
jgi:hypothetical protein